MATNLLRSFSLKTAMVSLVAAATLTGASAAQACDASGFLADLGCEMGVFDEVTANELDDIHAGLGNPLDHAAPVIADTIVPGSGALVAGIQQFNQMSPGLVAPQPTGQFPAQPSFQQPMQPQFGNLCVTVSGYYPGPYNPVGMPCQAMTPWGIQSGVVVQ